CCRPMTPQYRPGFCSITGIFGVRRLAAAFESGSKLPHSKSGCVADHPTVSSGELSRIVTE
ncbi:MAG: hypothetical protein ABSG78_22660, partial [Verrucomicrobiota bacterium]